MAEDNRAGVQSKGEWSRKAQDAGEAGFPVADPPEPVRVPLLDQPVGYVTVRWAVVLGGMILGAFAFIVAVGRVVSDPWEAFILDLPAALLGALMGGLATGLVLYLLRRFGNRNAEPS